MKRLAIVSTHPIQYNAPLFQLLAERHKAQIKVFYTWSESEKGTVYDPDFGIETKWDIPLLEGYDHEFVPNDAARPGSDHFSGIRNPGLTAAIRAFAPDAILVYGWSFNSHVRLMRHFKGKIPVWFRGDSTLMGNAGAPGWKQWLRKQVLGFVYRQVDMAFYAGARNKEYFREYGLQERQLCFAPHAIENRRFGAGNSDGGLRERLRIPPESVCLLYAGKLQPVKNLLFLLRNFLDCGHADMYLIIAGNGVQEAELKEMAAGSDRIIFLPFQNQSAMPMLYRAADIFLLPSLSETWGLSVNEAMASGRPALVSSQVGCAADLVRPGETGLIFESDEAGSLCRALDTLHAAGTEQLRSWGRNAKEMIASWSYEHCAGALERSLESLGKAPLPH